MGDFENIIHLSQITPKLSKKLSKMDKKNPQYKKYNCYVCKYYTNNRKDFNRHINTIKHKKKDKGDNKKPQIIPQKVEEMGKMDNRYYCACGKSYKWQSGLSKHKKKCSFMDEEIQNVKRMLFTFMKDQKTFNNEIKERTTVSTINNNYTNCTNNQMTLNVFLNEKCKDAINLTDFINNIRISIEDLYYTKTNGHANGISKIFVKNLKDLEPTVRPIHCTDKKAMEFYVKDNDIWEKDKNNTKIDKSIHDMKMMQIKKLQDWEKLHPNYLENQDLLKEWHELVHGVIGAADDYTNNMANDTIKKSLSNTTEVSTNFLLTDKD